MKFTIAFLFSHFPITKIQIFQEQKDLLKLRTFSLFQGTFSCQKLSETWECAFKDHLLNTYVTFPKKTNIFYPLVGTRVPVREGIWYMTFQGKELHCRRFLGTLRNSSEHLYCLANLWIATSVSLRHWLMSLLFGLNMLFSID